MCYILRFGKVGQVLVNFFEIFFCFSSTARNNWFQDIKNFLEVFRNMPDTLPKFGGDCRSSFRALVSTKLKNFENRRFLNKFIKGFVEKSSILGYFQRLFEKICSILCALMLENYLRDRPEICGGVSPHALVCEKHVLGHCTNS